jgi:1,4-dihydroxy-6-naphthoate synthase
MTTSLAVSPCPNDTFVFHAWIHGLVPDAPPVEVTYADIDVTNHLAEQGTLDVLKVSYAALPWLLRDYALLPTGGALGRGCGPLVLTAGRSSLKGARVAVPSDRSTAYLLYRLWPGSASAASVDGVSFERIMPAVARGEYDAGLVIHEARFTYASHGLTAIQDLGEWWEQHTGLAIPLGAIVARRSLDRHVLTKAIRGSLDLAWGDPSLSRDFVLSRAQEMDPTVADRHIGLYVNEHTYDLGVDGYDAVRGLLTRAEAAGLVPPVDPAALD